MDKGGGEDIEDDDSIEEVLGKVNVDVASVGDGVWLKVCGMIVSRVDPNDIELVVAEENDCNKREVGVDNEGERHEEEDNGRVAAFDNAAA